MPPAAPSSVKKEVVALPLALIDAQDEHFVSPLREFLSSRGCEVIVNHHTARPLTYHLISGEASFVKEILSRALPAAQKRLIILWAGGSHDLRLPHGVHARVISIDARPLEEETVQRIFTFFFTGRKEFLDIRKDQSSPLPVIHEVRQQRRESPPAPRPVHRHVPAPPVHSPVFIQDAQRVSQTIADIFSVRGSSQHVKPADKKNARPGWIHGIALIAALWICTWGVYIGSLAFGAGSLVVAGRMMLRGNQATGSRMVQVAGWFARGAGRMLPVVGTPLTVVGLGDVRASQEQIISLLLEASSAAAGVNDILKTGQQVSAALFHSAGEVAAGSAAHDIAQLRTQIGSVQNHLALSQAQLDRLRLPSQFAQARQTLVDLRETVGYLDQLLTLFPHMAGFAEPQTYLFLFQNSMEMRPTGGFIGSIATATFDGGKMNELAVEDVYTLDGQLKGHVDPPAPVRELIGQEHWYLRDSNWDPDFRSSATQAAWFYEKEAGKQVDGVIAINVPFIIDLLRATGPLTLTDFNDRITADNFFGKSLLYTQTDFFPGSTQKKDFLGSLAGALIGRVTREEGVDAGGLLRALIAGLRAKNILFYFPDPELQALVTQYDWAGEMTPVYAQGTDGIAVVEANVGINKANYFVTREALHQVALAEDGSSSNMITLRYHNASTGDQGEGGGAYRSYLRLLLPKGSVVEAVSVNGIALQNRDLTRAQAVALPFAQKEEGDAMTEITGIAFEVPPLGDAQVSVSYRRSGAVLLDERGGEYVLTVRKQPGYKEGMWQTNVMFPIFWQPTFIEGEPVMSYVANQGRLEYNTNGDKDARMSVRFDK